MNRFGDHDVGEIAVLRFGFDKDFAPGDLPTSITLDVEMHRGADPSPTLIKSGDVLVDGQDVLQRVAGGVVNGDYHFRCRAVGSASGLAAVVAGYMKVVRK